MKHANNINKQNIQSFSYAKKYFGQNYLIDKNILDKIIDSAQIDLDTYVIEIGPGTGLLTEELLKKAKKVLAYEIDKDLIPYLKIKFADKDNLILIHDDFLKRNFQKDIDDYFEKSAKIIIVSNLPYYITTPIISKILESSVSLQRMIVMVQKEVAKRITATPNHKEYGAFSVIVSAKAKTKILFSVSRNAFRPEPKVDSAVVLFDFTNNISYNLQGKEKLSDFLYLVFQQKRKTLINNLLMAYPQIKRDLFINILINLSFKETIRAENLDLEQFIKLYNEVMKLL